MSFRFTPDEVMGMSLRELAWWAETARRAMEGNG